VPKHSVYLNDEVDARLREVAHRERRRPADQLAVIVTKALDRDDGHEGGGRGSARPAKAS
jgi:hypothetical protein